MSVSTKNYNHMNIRERFRKLAELLNSYEDRDGKLIEIDDQTIDYIEQEVAKIQIDKLIEDVPNINPVWLITGNGSPFGDSHHSKTAQQVSGTGNVGVNFGRSSGGGTAHSVVNQTIITASPMRQKARCSRYYAK